MHYKNLFTVFAITAVFLLCISFYSAQAQEESSSHKNYDSKMYSSLNLTEEQKTKIKQIHQEQRPLIESSMEEIKNRIKKFKEIFVSTATSKEVAKEHEKIESLHKKMFDLHFKTMLKIREVLNSEQRKKFIEKMEKMMHFGPMGHHSKKEKDNEH